MKKKLQELKWILHCWKKKQLLIYGLSTGLIQPYNEELLEKLRTIYYGGVPASIILLCNGLSNGFCFDRATLLSRAFLEDDGDVKLLYAFVDSLKLNPEFITDDPLYALHCVVERITEDGRHLIYDTSDGFVYAKELYDLIEKPVVTSINSKDDILKYVESDKERYLSAYGNDEYVMSMILPFIKMTYGRPTEPYSHVGLLQREIELYESSLNNNL